MEAQLRCPPLPPSKPTMSATRGHDPRYRDLREDELPATECLKDTVARFLPFWHKEIVPALHAGRKILIAAHGNSLRAPGEVPG